MAVSTYHFALSTLSKEFFFSRKSFESQYKEELQISNFRNFIQGSKVWKVSTERKKNLKNSSFWKKNYKILNFLQRKSRKKDLEKTGSFYN